MLHQILLQYWWYPSGNNSQDSTIFRGRCHEYLIDGVVQQLKKWPHISGQQTTFRQTLNKPKWECYLASADCNRVGLSYHSPRNCDGVRVKHWISTFNFDQEFVHEESVCQIQSEAAKNGAETMPSGHAEQCKQWPKLSERRDHRRWDMGLWVRPKNEDVVVTVN